MKFLVVKFEIELTAIWLTKIKLLVVVEEGKTNFTFPGVELISPKYLVPDVRSNNIGGVIPKLKLSITR